MTTPDNPKLFNGEFAATDITLRDLFALAAFVAVHARGGLIHKPETGEYCYNLADIMLNGRQRQ